LAGTSNASVLPAKTLTARESTTSLVILVYRSCTSMVVAL
jgi:hypothetical protein